MLTVVTLWWLLFWTAVGLSVGSFLNVVIYRLPRGESLRAPIGSACPFCRRPIRWHDNIPILSFLILRGRCRACRAPIPTRYLVIEAAMAVIVLLLLDAFFIGRVRGGLSGNTVGLNDRLAYDWPVFLAHVILFASLLSMSAIDLEHYWVDVRFTNVATVAGFVLHMLWIPRLSAEWGRPFDTTAVVSICAMVGLAVTWIVMICQPHADPEDFGWDSDSAAEGSASYSLPATTPSLDPSRIAGWVMVIMLALFLGSLFAAEHGAWQGGFTIRALIALGLFFILIVSESAVVRASDRQIIEAIEEERHDARKMVLTELTVLLPAVVLAILGAWLVVRVQGVPGRVHDVLYDRFFLSFLDVPRGWSPLMGFATAASGYIIAGAIGWSVRIVFTLIFGKEAFGSGDIHLMAATGCVAGWPVVLMGFILTCILALGGWILTLPFKRSRALPLGPWLSLSFLAVVVFYDRLIALPIVERTVELVRLLFFENSQRTLLGSMQ